MSKWLLVLGVGVVAAGGGVYFVLPDLKRYLTMRRM